MAKKKKSSKSGGSGLSFVDQLFNLFPETMETTRALTTFLPQRMSGGRTLPVSGADLQPLNPNTDLVPDVGRPAKRTALGRNVQAFGDFLLGLLVGPEYVQYLRQGRAGTPENALFNQILEQQAQATRGAALTNESSAFSEGVRRGITRGVAEAGVTPRSVGQAAGIQGVAGIGKPADTMAALPALSDEGAGFLGSSAALPFIGAFTQSAAVDRSADTADADVQARRDIGFRGAEAQERVAESRRRGAERVAEIQREANLDTLGSLERRQTEIINQQAAPIRQQFATFLAARRGGSMTEEDLFTVDNITDFMLGRKNALGPEDAKAFAEFTARQLQASSEMDPSQLITMMVTLDKLESKGLLDRETRDTVAQILRQQSRKFALGNEGAKLLEALQGGAPRPRGAYPDNIIWVNPNLPPHDASVEIQNLPNYTAPTFEYIPSYLGEEQERKRLPLLLPGPVGGP